MASLDTSTTSQSNFGSFVDFIHVMKMILNDDDFLVILNENNCKYRKTIEGFLLLEEISQKVFVKIFLRIQNWVRLSMKKNAYLVKFKDGLQSLYQNKYLINENELSFEEAVKLLLSKEKCQILRETKLNLTYGSLEEFIFKSQNSTSIARFFNSSSKTNIRDNILSKIKLILGECFSLNQEIVDIFENLFIVFHSKFHLNLASYERKPTVKNMCQQLLFQLSNIRTQKIILPNYSITLYPLRERIVEEYSAFEKYSQFIKIYYRFKLMLENKKKQEALEYAFPIVSKELDYLLGLEDNEDYFNAFLNDEKEFSTQQSLTLTHYRFVIKICTNLLELLDSFNKIQESVDLAYKLLLQKVFYKLKRGFIYERLILNVEKRLKNIDLAIMLYYKALKDTYLDKSSYYVLSKRIMELKISSQNDKLNNLQLTCSKFLESFKYEENVVNIQLKQVNDEYSKRPKYVNEHEGHIEVLNVEQSALFYYKYKENFQDGIHTESSVYLTIYYLLFFDIIYGEPDDPIEIAFISQFQLHPIDFYSDKFYICRKNKIKERLVWIENCLITELANFTNDQWLRYYGQYQSIINWESYSSEYGTILIDFIDILGVKTVAGICRIFAKNYVTRRSGLPDLLVWNKENKNYKIVEVKSTNDKLSTKQILWIDDLVKLGANVEICQINKKNFK